MKWVQRLFKPEPSHWLAVLRVSLLAYLLVFRFDERLFLFDWSQTLPAAFMNKGWLLAYAPFPFPMTLDQQSVFFAILRSAGYLALVGFFTRFHLILFSIGWTFVVAQESAWGWHDHGPSLVVQVLLILCLAPGISAYSLDGIIKKLFRNTSLSWKNALNLPTQKWVWQAILALTVLFYTTSGVSKLRYGGLQWLNGETIAFYFSGQSDSSKVQQFGSRSEVPSDDAWRDGYGLDFYIYGSQRSDLGSFIASNRFVSSLTACAGVGLELFFLSALFSRKLRILFLLAGCCFHIMVYCTMGISFMSWVMIDSSLLVREFLQRASKHRAVVGVKGYVERNCRSG